MASGHMSEHTLLGNKPAIDKEENGKERWQSVKRSLGRAEPLIFL